MLLVLLLASASEVLAGLSELSPSLFLRLCFGNLGFALLQRCCLTAGRVGEEQGWGLGETSLKHLS